jgi:hypothetical protein
MSWLRRERTLNEILLEEAGLDETLTPEPPRVDASESAVAFVRNHGGRVYVWLDASGLSHTTMAPPEHPVDFVRLDAAGFELYQDVSIETPRFWTVVHRRLLHRVSVLWENGLDADASGGGG